MRSALADDDTLDCRPAHGAGLTLTTIDPEMILEVATAVNPVNAGAISTDAFFQHLPDGHP